MPCGNDSSGITAFTTTMLPIDQIISCIEFHLTVYGSIACARGRSSLFNSTLWRGLFAFVMLEAGSNNDLYNAKHPLVLCTDDAGSSFSH
jgi:hypothetical protein